METEKLCPNCRKPLPPDVPLGLCPECLIKSGFPTESEPGTGAGGIGRFVPPPVEEIARLFPQFEILGFIGKGGMGAVYKARQPALDRLVALKVLPPAVASDPGFAERFNREARALARLSHPNIVAVYDFGKTGPLHYLVMEFVDGTNLRQVEQAGRLSADQALAIVPQICEALQFAHNEGIVHRDIKPENLLLDKKGRIKITDFGIAKILDVVSGKAALTGAKDVVGTPHYMAPEQVEKPQAVDHRADIYSLGVVFYEMLTGELPLGKFAPPSKMVQVDVRLDEVVLHTLEKEPERRYQQASQVKTDVETIAGTPPPIAGAAAISRTAPAVAPPGPHAPASDKIILPAFLLAFFFGIFGAHRFYVGKIGTGIVQLFTFGGFGIWATIDWILILCKVFTDADGRRLMNWWHPYNGPPKPAKPPRPPRPQAPPVIGGNLFGETFGGTAPMIVAPAVALMVAGFIKVLGGFLLLFDLEPNARYGGYFLSQGIFSQMPEGPLFGPAEIMLVIVPAVLMIYGATEMIRRGNYAWAVAASVMGILFCSTLGFPAGIWALVVLLIPGTRENFSNSPAPIENRNWLKILGGTAVAGLMLFLVFSISDHERWRATHTMKPRARAFAQTVVGNQGALQPLPPQAPQMPQQPEPPQQPQQPQQPQPQPPQATVSAPAAAPAPPAVAARPATPAPQTATQKQILPVRLNAAQMELTNMEVRYSVGTATSEDVDSARDNVDILTAELAGDAVQVAKIKVLAARRKLNQDTLRWQAGLIQHDEVVRAQADCVVAQAELRQAMLETKVQLPFGPLFSVLSATTGAPLSYQWNFTSNSTSPPQGSAPPAPTRDQRQRLQSQLDQAQTELENIEARHNAGTASLEDVDAARVKVGILQAELDGDVEGLARARESLLKAQAHVRSLVQSMSAPPSYQGYDASNSTSPPANLNSSPVQTNVQSPATTNPPSTNSNSDPDPIHKTVEVGDSTDISQSFDVAPGGELKVDVDRGSVSVTAADQSTVTIHLTRDVTGTSDPIATKILKDEHVKFIQTGSQISITADTPPELQHSGFFNHANLDANYEITVPRQFDARVGTMGGDVHVSGVLGTADVHTMGGSLICKDIGGDLKAHTMGGDVQAGGCKGRMDLQTMGGSINIDSFTGPSVAATTSGGSVSAEFVNAPTADSNLHTMGGNVTVWLPDNAALKLDGRTFGGSVRSDFPVKINDQFGNDSLTGPINGGGPLLKMDTEGGNVEVYRRKL